MGMPRLSHLPQYRSVLDQINKAFKKKHTLTTIPLPSMSTLYRMLQGDLPTYDLVCLWAFWTCVCLALRAKELMLLSPKYMQRAPDGGYTITWPSALMKNGIKAGRVRHVHRSLAKMADVFCACKKNPFIPLYNNDRLNKFLTQKLGITMRSARHCGAYLVLEETKTVASVANALGHANMICAAYYLDPWVTSVHHDVVTQKIVKLLADKLGTSVH
jgi:hypothetical protein